MRDDAAIKATLTMFVLGFAVLGAVALSLLVGCSHLPAVIEGVQAATNAVPVIVGPQEPEQPAQPAQPASGDAIDPQTIRTKGSRANLHPKNARIKPGLDFKVRHTARGIEFDYNPHGWVGGETVARIYAYYDVDGQMIGGQWDDVRPNQRFKERKNLTGFVDSKGEIHGPRFGVAPRDGQPVAYSLSNLANTERSEIVWASNRWGER